MAQDIPEKRDILEKRDIPGKRDIPEKCPPHWFEAAWTGTEESSTGAIFCRWCGEIRPLEVQKIEAPVEELIEGRFGGVNLAGDNGR